MKKGIFRRIFILYALLILLSGLFGEMYITSAVRENHIDNLRQNLSVQITLISKSISFNQTNLDNLCKQFKKDTGARVTVIANDGKVIGDSDTDSALMDNHLHRTEIEQALLFDVGMAKRYSDTLKYDFLYVAKKISHNEKEEGFIRLAVPLKEVDHSVNLLRIRIILVVLSVLLITWIFSVWQTDHLRRLLRQITDFSRSLSRGEIDKRLFLKNAGEFNEIADNLTSMSVKLQGMMAQNEEEKNRLNVILKSVPDALLIIDAKGVITLSSSSAKEFFGDIPMTGMRFVEVVRNHEFSDLMEEARRSHSPGMTEFSIETPVEKYLSVRVSPLFYKENELSGFLAVFHDITQIEKLEQVRKDFVANVSHEIKTPITAIKGFADTLLEGALEDKENAAGFIRTIKANSERINSLVDDLMTISKIELGVIKVEKTMIDIDDVFNTVLALFYDKAAAKSLSLAVSNRPGLLEIDADRNRLIQILTNLVDNAMKFTEAGGVTFGIDQEDEETFLFVEDTGIGVPAKYLPRLGERFYRVDPARSRKMGGTGLGLAIVKHLVKAHGWTMQIESAPGKGTRVKIIL
ncbi:MAG: ATP-binding protein [Nitrospirae bacterium]|nr:ATP-binding protein [Nitrospirota bacterium]MCL5421949.1 ATP-binding protein [Nitrospirota bacterium]